MIPSVPTTRALLDVVVVLAVGLAMVLGVGPVLRRLPEPETHDPADPEPPPESDRPTDRRYQVKTLYRDLARRGFTARAALLAAASATVVVIWVPPRFWPPWLVLCTLGVLLGCVDGATTWLPWRLTWPGWFAMAAAGLLSVASGAHWPDLFRLLAAGLIAWLWYLIVYFLTRRQLGLGDVWLAPLIGAPAGLISLTALYLALLLGAIAGGIHGLLLLARGRRGGFPYAPAMIIGGVLTPVAVAVLTVVRS